MARIIQSPAFEGGYASYQPLDADEAWLLDHPNLAVALSGSGLSMREVDNLWDDLKTPRRFYRPAGTLDTGARPSTAVGGRPPIRIPGGAAGRLIGNVAMPASYTFMTAFRVDVPATGATQVVLGSASAIFPRFALSVTLAGAISMAHNVPGRSISIPGPIPAQTDTLV